MRSVQIVRVKVKRKCGALRDLVALQPATLLKLTLLHGCFSRFLNCTNATKLRNASQIPTGSRVWGGGRGGGLFKTKKFTKKHITFIFTFKEPGVFSGLLERSLEVKI